MVKRHLEVGDLVLRRNNIGPPTLGEGKLTPNWKDHTAKGSGPVKGTTDPQKSNYNVQKEKEDRRLKTSNGRINNLAVHNVLEETDLVGVEVKHKDRQLGLERPLSRGNSSLGILGQILTLFLEFGHRYLGKIGSNLLLGNQAAKPLSLRG
ncbi:hypothetical protein PIB30_055408 [Stylosanthes scabra]|uniref:Uncharacterized protein n=1 Tax=Stylosanthes scabra TaxID=79078 RepID=A0ABU6WHE0_9FABA|nr:hypothetical protein [Stylosanthes scabra]